MTPRSTRSARKDVLTNTSSDDNSPRQRGRPRLDIKDQNIAERRRTQIRLAQRAYRQRKETTISGLNRRVTSLENTIEDMHRNFLVFNDKAVASEMRNNDPVLAMHLETTANLLAKLAKNSAYDLDAEDQGELAVSFQPTEVEGRQVKDQSRKAIPDPNQVSVFGYQTTFGGADDDDRGVGQQNPTTQAELENTLFSEWTSTEAVRGYQIQNSEMNDTSSGSFEEVQHYTVPAPEANLVRSFGRSDVIQQDSLVSEDSAMQYHRGSSALPPLNQPPSDTSISSVRSLSNNMSLPSPGSYASQEVSFARRLMRSALEEGYRLMTSPRTSPEEFERALRFSLCFAKTSTIVHYLRSVMGRTATENLELWNVPQFHLGGAGLHYPRVGIDAAGPPPEWWANKAPIGPLHPPPPENPMPNSSVVEVAERFGYGGEWFDSNDVEQYLRSKGLYLDGQSSIVELTEEEPVSALNETQVPLSTSLGDSSSHESPGGPRSPGDMDIGWPDRAFLQGAGVSWEGDAANLPASPDLNMGLPWGDPEFLSQKPISPSLDFSTLADTMPTFNTRMKKCVDVEKFVKTIVQSAFCLGRTPGFRRAAVDSALTVATVEQF